MSRLFNRLRTPTLQNTGSTARDHLASERTFLAWLRTGLGFIALGIGVERFSTLEVQSRSPNSSLAERSNLPGETPAEAVLRQKQQDAEHEQEQQIVAALLGTGTASIVYGATRYFTNFRLLTHGLFKPAYHGAAMLSVAVAGLAGGAWLGFANDAAKERHGKRLRKNVDE